MSLTNENTVNLKSASFVVIMLLHEGLTHTHSQKKKPRLHFVKSFTFYPQEKVWLKAFTCNTVFYNSGLDASQHQDFFFFLHSRTLHMWTEWGADSLSSQRTTDSGKKEISGKWRQRQRTWRRGLNKLSALTPAVLGPSLDSSASDGVHIARVYDVWQSCHRYQACVR